MQGFCYSAIRGGGVGYESATLTSCHNTCSPFSARIMSKAVGSPSWSSYWLSLITLLTLDSVSRIADKTLLVIINVVYPIHIFTDGGPLE